MPVTTRRLSHHLLGSVAFGPLALLLAGMTPANAQNVLPQGGAVAAGQATIGARGNNGLTITQTSASAVINWNSYSIGQPNTVTYVQPNSSSAILNRVTGGTPSTIAGQLDANGQVYIVNPNGIAITPTGTVNVGGGFVASTLSISDDDFMAGKRTFTGNGASASVSNAGAIHVDSGGFVGLLGGTVANDGLIAVPLGKVGLGSGEQITLDLTGDGFMQVAAPTAATAGGKALVDVSGRIAAAGGTIELKAATVKQAIRDAVNVSGELSARSVSGHNGAIVLSGGAGGNVTVSGRLNVSAGRKANATNGGTISVSGAKTTIAAKARLKATSATAKGGAISLTGTTVSIGAASLNTDGATGGGTILIGGGPQGTGALTHAQTVNIASGATLSADATQNGDGGQVVVWSDGTTSVYGALKARGAGLGNGGAVETSGQSVDFTGITVNTSAPNGKTGTWLVDPEDLTIDATAAATISSNLATTDITLQTTSTTAAGIGVVTSGGQGDITIDSGISWSSGQTLTLNSYNAISVDAPITLAGGGLALLAGGALAVNAPITVTGAGSVNLNAAYDTTTVSGTSLLELSFGQGASLSYTGAPNSGQTLTINGQAYTLLYKLAESGSTGPDSGTDDIAGIDASGDAGHYALATNLIGTATFSSAPAGGGSNDFTGVFEGLGHTITNLTINDPTYWGDVGLFGRNSGVIRDIGLVGGTVSGGPDSNSVGGLVGDNYAGTIANSYATGAVSAGSSNVGGLVGTNYGWPGNATIVNSYATGAVIGGQYSDVGGLVGLNQSYGSATTISNSYATGAATGENFVGGLVGLNESQGGTATISNSYATGAATGEPSFVGGPVGPVGGLVGENYVYTGAATISNSYATGAVSGGFYLGGLVAISNAGLGAVTNSYWDVSTTGRSSDGARASASTAPGSVNGYNPSTGSIGLTTAQLQSGVASFTGSAFAGGAGGLYPYLESFFPNGVQAISGTAYSDAGGTPLASGTNGAVTVSIDGNGSAFGSATTGANGYYYVFGPANTLAGGSSVLAYTTANSATGVTDAATLVTSAGAAAQTGVNVYGKTLSVATSATTLSAAPSLALVETDAAAAAGSDANAQEALGGATGRGILATGTSFTIDQPITTANAFLVQTGASASLTVAQPITISGFGSLGLLSGGSLAIDAPINVTGAGSVDLAAAYDTTTVPGTSLLELSFGQSASLSYTGAPNTGQALKINGQAYTLLYKLADGTTGLPDNGTDDIAGIDTSGDAGHYALADNLIGTATFSTALAGAGANVFTGVFEGLGHTITDLTINDPASADYVGLFGRESGVIRDIGLVGGAVSGDYLTGGLVGINYGGAIVSSYATDAVSGVTYVGGLVGANVGLLSSAAIVNSYAAGAVIGGQTSDVGGLVGLNEGALAAATISDSYATGAVSSGHYAGGLVGRIYAVGGAATIANSYATGAVSGPNAGGLVALNNAGVGAVTNSYWDVSTTGQTGDGALASGTGAVNGYNPSTGSIGLTTAQLQSGVASFTGSAFAGGAGGLYPYLASFFPDGVQAISGTAYSGAGLTPLASTASGAVTVDGFVNGAGIGAVTTGANGYYYFVVPAGTISASGSPVLAATETTGATGATFATATGTTTGLDIWGDWLRASTGSASLTALDSALSQAIGGDAATTTLVAGLANERIAVSGTSFDLDTALSRTGVVALDGAGAFTQSAGSITSSGLVLTGGGAFTLADANAVTTLAANAGAVTFNDGRSLTIGALLGTAGVTATGAVSLAAAGDLTIASGAHVAGASPVLAAMGAFINDAGSAAVSANSGRWLIYSSDPSADAFDNLDSANMAVWDTAAGASVAASGNRYVFAYQPVLTVTSTDATKTYGDDATAAVAASYTIAGLQSGVANAYLADTAAAVYSGAPSATSIGSAVSASVAGSPYGISAAQGTLVSLDNYAFGYANTGRLTVNARPITVAADPVTKFFGTPDPALTYRFVSGGLVNGDTLGGGLSRVSGDTPGAYPILVGTLSADGNYILSYLGNSLTIVGSLQSTAFASSFTSNDGPDGPRANIWASSDDSPTCSYKAVSQTLKREGRVVLTGGGAANCH